MQKTELLRKIKRGEVIEKITTRSESGMVKTLKGFKMKTFNQKFLTKEIHGKNISVVIGVCDEQVLQIPNFHPQILRGRCVFFPDHLVSAQ